MHIQTEQRRNIYDRTNGKCSICHKQLAYTNYAQFGKRGAWEIDHSRPRKNGGNDHLNNLRAACISCNRRKGARGARYARTEAGVTGEPPSKDAVLRQEKIVTMGGLGMAAGFILAGPAGLMVGGLAGAVLAEFVGDSE